MHGYQATRVQDISSAAGISRAGFYLYFGAKSDAFAAVLGDFRDSLECAMARYEARPITRVRANARRQYLSISTLWLSVLGDRADAADIVLNGAALDVTAHRLIVEFRRSVRAVLVTRISAMQRLGVVRSDVDAELMATFQLGVYSELARSRRIPRDVESRHELARSVTNLFLEGVQPNEP